MECSSVLRCGEGSGRDPTPHSPQGPGGRKGTGWEEAFKALLFIFLNGGSHLGEASCMGGRLAAWYCHPGRRFLDGNDPDEDEAAGEDVDEGDKLGEEAVLHVTRSLKVPLEDCNKDKVNSKNYWYL